MYDACKSLIKVHQDFPWNAEPALEELLDYPVTPYALLYTRNHCEDMPKLKADGYAVTVDGMIKGQKQTVTLERVKQLPSVTHEVAMQCAGLRRDEMNDKQGQTEGVAWSSGAISNCSYTGVLLSVVLHDLGIRLEPQAKFVQFGCHQVCSDDSMYGSSIPVAMITTNDVMLAYGLNGESMPASHGGPLRVVIPGVYGARSVKWLDVITFSDMESSNFYQRHDYKVLPEQIKSQEQANDEDIWDHVAAMTEVSPNSVIIKSSKSSCYRGYAVSGCAIDRVDVSFDDCRSWTPARITHHAGKWSWSIFEIQATAMTEQVKYIYSRAADVQGRLQPSQAPWNLRGVGNNGYGVCAA